MKILYNHDQSKPLGNIEHEKNCLRVSFYKPYIVTKEMFFNTFNCGAIINYSDCGEFVASVEIKEFSISL